MLRFSRNRWTTLIFLPYVVLIIFFNITIDLFGNDLVKEPNELLKKEWHDYKSIYLDSQRNGLGEQGKSAVLSGGDVNRNLEKELWRKYGFNALLSDAISVNRSVADKRDEGCRHKKYLTNLPAISIVIPFYNEHFSVLLRSLYSLINRTPPELLKEIILVDDFSDRNGALGSQLDQFVAEHFEKVQIVRLPERMGLIRARTVGIRKTTAEVLVILDSHIEVTYNWLPPLLEPIVRNKRTVVCPLIDRIGYSNFKYEAVGRGRGGFDWNFFYAQIAVLPEDLMDTTKPYKNIIMNGGLFAISAEFFWELGGYDESLDIRGGEQYELSFKIWMCGGQLLDAPCSRIGHLYRDPQYAMPNPRKNEYKLRNYKRVVEVWMDEYKNYMFKNPPNKIYENIDPGNITVQKALRKKLHCKSFKWFLETIAFDLIKFYPPVEPPDYAHGAIQNVQFPNLCLSAVIQPIHSKAKLLNCTNNLTNPPDNQKFVLSWRRDLRLHSITICLEVQPQNIAWMWTCHGTGGNQFWYYDRKNKWLIHRKHGHWCLEASPDASELYVNKCREKNPNMQWNFGVVNDTAMDSFFEGV